MTLDITFVTFGNSFYTSAEFTIVIVTISGVDCVNVSKFWNEFQRSQCKIDEALDSTAITYFQIAHIFIITNGIEIISS